MEMIRLNLLAQFVLYFSAIIMLIAMFIALNGEYVTWALLISINLLLVLILAKMWEEEYD